MRCTMERWVTATPFGFPGRGWRHLQVRIRLSMGYPTGPVDPDVKITYASSSQSMDAGSMPSRAFCSVSLAKLWQKLLSLHAFKPP